MKLEKLKGAWVKELSFILWAYRTIRRTPTGETPFSLAYRSKAIISVELGLPNYRRAHFSTSQNDENLSISLNLIEDIKNAAQVNIVTYQ